MNRDKETSAVEGVGSREQGNIQTQRESNSCLGLGASSSPEYYTTTGGRTGDTAETDSWTTGTTTCFATVNGPSVKPKKKTHSEQSTTRKPR